MLAVAAGCAAAVVIIIIVVALLVRQRKITTRLRGRLHDLEGAEHSRAAEVRHLVTVRLPALAETLYERPVDIPGPKNPKVSGTPFGESLESVMPMYADSVERAKARADESAKSTLKSMMRGVQSLANEQQLAISAMQSRHDDPDVLDGLLKIDHMNAQLGRRAQATAVLCGSWPGQQRSSSSLTDVVRGATSRIRDYLRVKVHPYANVAVLSRVVEPVVLAVAELLDNAARHSQPNTSVEVNFQPAHNGVAIVIDDAGVAMNPEELKRAEHLLSGVESIDINRIGDPPQIGFALIGVLAARYGFTVSVDTRSPYGGVRAVVFLPTSLLTRVENLSRAVRPTPAPRITEPPEQATGPSPAEPADVPAKTAGGLPKRRRATAEPKSERPEGSETGSDAPEQNVGSPRPARQVAAGLGAWQRGTRSGRSTTPPDTEGKPQA